MNSMIFFEEFLSQNVWFGHFFLTYRSFAYILWFPVLSLWVFCVCKCVCVSLCMYFFVYKCVCLSLFFSSILLFIFVLSYSGLFLFYLILLFLSFLDACLFSNKTGKQECNFWQEGKWEESRRSWGRETVIRIWPRKKIDFQLKKKIKRVFL